MRIVRARSKTIGGSLKMAKPEPSQVGEGGPSLTVDEVL